MAASDPRHDLGALAEGLVAQRLTARGFTVLGRNVRVGRLEIDLIARRGKMVVFCEVRARRSSSWVHPLETIGPKKIANIREAARRWLLTHKRNGCAIRFDAAAVTFDSASPVLEYVEDAF
ncbi:MAG: YraN family protein [Sandaracinaceae bacterium]